MNNNTMNSGWLGAGVVDLSRIGGPASAMARPRHGKVVVFGDPTATPRSGVQQLA
jgi:hypothetical protein